MSELKATPGPWVVHPLQAWVSPEADIDMPICELRMATDGVSCEEQARLDGYLIASAPDLYEALDDLLQSYGNGLGAPLASKARRALARARGDVR